ncbi:MAG: hypothetical protein M3Q07_18990 [Pseudobdellovibrionaceae bacterium]|nr:hypothetical protein [Pseudobdellovibrionaceae bacterium]
MIFKKIGKSVVSFLCLSGCGDTHFLEEPEVYCEGQSSISGCYDSYAPTDGTCPQGTIKVRKVRTAPSACPVAL